MNDINWNRADWRYQYREPEVKQAQEAFRRAMLDEMFAQWYTVARPLVHKTTPGSCDQNLILYFESQAVNQIAAEYHRLGWKAVETVFDRTIYRNPNSNVSLTMANGNVIVTVIQ